ncbi:LysE family translocator [Francisellaceae bacterium]|nr:LysE family translocator [Francisellaceae bacterium]
MIASLFTLLCIQMIAVSLPGPDFFIVTRSTLKHGRLTGYLCSLGIACGILVYASVCVFGLGAIHQNHQYLIQIISIFGACFLFYLSFKCLTAKKTNPKDELSEGKKCNKKTAWLTGFLTNLSNPKVMVFFISILPLFLQDYPYVSYYVATIFIFVFSTLIWFSFVTTVIGHKKIRSAFLNYSYLLEKIFGVILFIFAILLIISNS